MKGLAKRIRDRIAGRTTSVMVERALTGRLSARGLARLRRRVDDDAAARRQLERAVDAMRILETAQVSEPELALVELRLLSEPARRRRTFQLAWKAAASAVAAALLVVWMKDDAMRAKGDGERPQLALEAYCARITEGGREALNHLRPARRDGCSLDEVLSFAYRAEPRDAPAFITLFGIDDLGEVLYYIPTPDTRHVAAVLEGQWQELERTVALSVHHRAGNVRVFALLADRVLSVDEVDAVAARLASAGLRDDSGEAIRPWHDAVLPLLEAWNVCPERACSSAYLQFEVRGARR